MKKLNIIIIGIAIIFFQNMSLFAQNETNTIVNNISISAETGASVGKINNINYFSTYTMPSFDIKVTPKLSVNTGLLFSSYQLDIPLFQENSISKTNHTAYKNYLFTQVNYSVNEKLTLKGSMIREMNNFNFSSNSPNNMLFKNYSIGADYQINEYLNIGVQFRQSSNNGMQYFNPYNISY